MAALEDVAGGSFDEFYASASSAAIRLAWLLTHDGHASEDIVQNAFLAVFQRFDTIDNPCGYLRRCIVNGVYEQSRRRARERRRMATVAGALQFVVDGPTGGLIDAIAKLPPNQRAAIVLRYWGDLDERAIADALDVRPGTVRSLLSRANTRLRKDLAP